MQVPESIRLHILLCQVRQDHQPIKARGEVAGGVQADDDDDDNSSLWHCHGQLTHQ